MHKKTFVINSLIRSGLVSILESRGLICTVKKVDHETFKAELKRKLVEETGELVVADTRKELVEELADVHEVLHVFMDAYQISIEEVESARLEKKVERGGFEEQLFVETIGCDADSSAVDYYRARGRKEVGEL